MTPNFRKIALLVLPLMLVAVTIFAATGIPVTATQTLDRTWRLATKLTQVSSEGNWVDDQLQQNYYNAFNASLLDSTRYSYQNGINNWVVGSSDHFSYNISQEYVTEIVTDLVMMSESIPMQRSVYNYDNENRLTSARLMVSGLDRDWIETKRIWLTYNGNALQQILTYDNSLIYRDSIFYKTEFQFDPQGRISVMSEFYSPDSLTWTNMYQTSFLYHPNDTTTAVGLVELISRGFYRYLHYSQPLEIGMVAEQSRQAWMYAYWRNDSRELFTYDNDNRLVSHLNLITDMGGVWQNNTLDTMNYYVQGTLGTDLQQLWNPDLGSWYDYKLFTYAWEPTTANDDDTNPSVQKLELAVYPNPFREKLNISLKGQSRGPVKLSLYDIKGRKIYGETVSGDAAKAYDAVKITNYIKASGVYLLQAEQNGHTTAVKLMHRGDAHR